MPDYEARRWRDLLNEIYGNESGDIRGKAQSQAPPHHIDAYQSVSIAPTSASATVTPLTMASP